MNASGHGTALANGYSWTKAASGKTYEVRNPATGEVVDEVPAGGPADVDKAAHAAQKAFASWSKLAPAKRAEILHKAARHMLGKVEEIAPILTREQGKTLLESRLEAQRFGLLLVHARGYVHRLADQDADLRAQLRNRAE